MITRGLLVASQIDHSVREYDRTTGAFVRVAASALGDPLGLVVGLDGNLLGHGTHLQGDICVRGGIRGDGQAGLGEWFEPCGGNLQVVTAGRQLGNPIVTIFICFRFALDAGCTVGGNDLRLHNRSSALVNNRAAY